MSRGIGATASFFLYFFFIFFWDLSKVNSFWFFFCAFSDCAILFLDMMEYP